MPIIALSAIGLMAFAGIDLTPLTRNVIIILSCCPAAVTMVILSNVFSLDAKLASAIWVVNNLTFILIVVPLLFVLLT
jgi:predicted permease